MIPECAYRRSSVIRNATINHCLLLQTSPAQCEGCTLASLKATGIKSWVVPHEGIDIEPMKRAVKAMEERVKQPQSEQVWLPCRHRRRKMRLSCCTNYSCKCVQCPLYKKEVGVKDCNECELRSP